MDNYKLAEEIEKVMCITQLTTIQHSKDTQRGETYKRAEHSWHRRHTTTASLYYTNSERDLLQVTRDFLLRRGKQKGAARNMIQGDALMVIRG